MLAEALGIEAVHAVGHVLHLLLWSVDNAPKGDLRGIPDSVIAIGAGFDRCQNDDRPSQRDAAEVHDPALIVEALIKCGWINPSRRLHNWNRYSGRLIQQRRIKARRICSAWHAGGVKW